MYESRIKHLEEMHRVLDKQIDGLEKTGNYSDDRLTNLKKQRLTFKDELAKLYKLQWEHDRETLDYSDDER
jgi:uncharacterized protein YdcH (DUF465 family)